MKERMVPAQDLSDAGEDLVRLAAAKDGEIAALKDEIENLQAAAGNDRAYITAMRSAQAQICEVIGVERGHDHWPEFMERVKQRIAALTEVLQEIADNCDPADPEWTNPADGRWYCYSLARAALDAEAAAETAPSLPETP